MLILLLTGFLLLLLLVLLLLDMFIYIRQIFPLYVFGKAGVKVFGENYDLLSCLTIGYSNIEYPNLSFYPNKNGSYIR